MEQTRKPVIIKADLYQLLSKRAEGENRTVTNMVDTLLRENLRWPTIDEDEPKPSARVAYSANPGKSGEIGATVPSPSTVEDSSSFSRAGATCKSCGIPLRPDHKCQMKGCKLFGKVQ